MIRHSLFVRSAHWLNAVAFVTLAVSGAAILLAHPELYWGETGYFGVKPLLSLGLEADVEQTGWGRNYHFLFAWIFVLNGGTYVVVAVLSGHARRRLMPRLRDLTKRSHSHAAGNSDATSAAAEHLPAYNLVQKLAYVGVVFVLGPLMLFSGLTMSPAVTAAFPELLMVFDGRQSARTLHFVGACALLLFLVVHIAAAFAAGSALLRSMFSGRYDTETPP